jgi:hypothetical protein
MGQGLASYIIPMQYDFREEAGAMKLKSVLTISWSHVSITGGGVFISNRFLLRFYREFKSQGVQDRMQWGQRRISILGEKSVKAFSVEFCFCRNLTAPLALAFVTVPFRNQSLVC